MPTDREAITPEQLKEWSTPSPHLCALENGYRCNTCELTALAQALLREKREKGEARLRADAFQQDWMQAKNDFGCHMAKARSNLAAAQRQIERLRDCLQVSGGKGPTRCVVCGGWFGPPYDHHNEDCPVPAALAAESEGAK